VRADALAEKEGSTDPLGGAGLANLLEADEVMAMSKMARIVASVGLPVLVGAGSPQMALAAPAPAPAPAAQPAAPRVLGVVPAGGTGTAPRTSTALAGRTGVTIQGAAPPLQYWNGPVMATTGAGVTVHAIYWAPSGYGFPSGFKGTMNGFIDDVADGSGQSDNVVNVATQYYQRVNGVESHLTDTVRSTPALDDADRYPVGATGCVPDPGLGFTACVTNAQLGAELTALLARHGLPGGYADQYSVFFPPGVETCDGSVNSSHGGSCSSGTSMAGFCAFHSWTVGARPIIYANMPWVGYCTIPPTTYADGASAATADVSPTVHELTESMTDPNGGGWYDAHWNEMADECMGTSVAQPFGSAWWQVQAVFSNAAFAVDPGSACVTSLGTPVQRPQPLRARVAGMAARPDGGGYWVVDAAGGVSAHGAAAYFGSMAGVPLNAPISHIVATADGWGYWLVASDGGIFAFGDAPFLGSMGAAHLNAPVVDIAPTTDGRGYWMVASDGGVFAFGDARFAGSLGGTHLNRPVVGIAADVATGGYWMVASDGGVFAFGAPFFGSTGALTLNRPVVSMAAASGGSGYWFVASDGGVFSFDAPFQGSLGAVALNAPVVGMAGDSSTTGYWMVGADGGVFAFDAPFDGSN
jgi:hypothetical protein